jgi:predicted transcriptional regulator
MRKTPLNSNKDRILRFIQNNPGCYLRQIRNELDLSMGSVQISLLPAPKSWEDNIN